MRTTEVACLACGNPIQKPIKEANRSLRLGRHFYCNNACSAAVSNQVRKAKPVLVTCPVCQKRFSSSTKAKAAKFCSRSCASSGSMTPERRAAQSQAGLLSRGNLIPVSETLKLREAWKYVALRKLLRKSNRRFEFERRIGKYVYDLVLPDEKLIVEFDGPNHFTGRTMKEDALKTSFAEKRGYTVLRRFAAPMTVIHPLSLEGV